MSKLSDIPTMHGRNVSFQAPSFPLIPPFWNKMESILQKVGLSTLSKRFADEKIDPHVILAMSDSCLMRLGVETLGDRVRLKENCKQFAYGERRTNVASTSSGRKTVLKRIHAGALASKSRWILCNMQVRNLTGRSA